MAYHPHNPNNNYSAYPQYNGEPFHIENGPAPGGDLYNGVNIFSGDATRPSMRQSDKYNHRMHLMGYDQPVDAATIESGSANYFLDDSMGQLIGDNPGEGTHLDKMALNTEVITRYVVIDSFDRDWVNRIDESPYNFKISIGGGSKKSGGQLINASIDDRLDNVVSITCDNLTAPNRASITGYRHTQQPFLILSINGIDDSTYGSNSKLKGSLAQLVPKIPIPIGFQDVTYLEFANINNHTKVYKTPKNALTNMLISINKADGELINSKPVTGLASSDVGYGDVLGIKQIYYDGVDEDSENKYLDIVTSDYFTSDFFQISDTIKIRNWSFREAGLGYGEISQFTEFINRVEGHIIQLVNKSSGTTELNNIIRILAPGYYSQTTGNWKKENYFSDLITRTNINDNSSNDNTGKLININLQTQLFFRVNTIITNNNSTQHMIAPTS